LIHFYKRAKMASAMSEVSLDSEGAIKLKCKKCRQIIVSVDTIDADVGNFIYITEDSPPQWIESQIQQGGWTKGKLNCPRSCDTRVGGFDFVSGPSAHSDPNVSTQPIYIIKSKVDIVSHSTVNIISPTARAQSEISSGSGISTIVNLPNSDLDNTANLPTSDNSDHSRSSDSQTQTPETSTPELSQVEETTDSVEETTSSSNHTDNECMLSNVSFLISSQESSSEDEHFALQELSRRQIEKIKRRKKRKKKEKERAKKKQESKVEEKMRELLEGEPELDNLPDDLICPVCLDLLFEPFQTEPCRHIFCETCLRRLGQKNAMATKCPLCRSRIRFCKHLAATSREIREQHEAIYLRRKKFERSTPVFSYPLPWTPGWRNLLRGRPLGGNTIFVDENNQAEYMRTLLLQIPYYIPPVFLANLFNIIVFGFLLGIVELLPSLFYTLMGLRSAGSGSGGGINLTDAVSESSGDAADVVDGAGAGTDAITDSQIQSEQDTIIQPSESDGSIEAEALDSTFYFILFFISMLAAVAGQIIINHGQGRNRFGHRFVDTMIVLCLTCFPLLIIPTLLPYRAPQGNYLGSILKKLFIYAIDNISVHTAILILLVSLIYHLDVIDEMIA